MLQMTLRYYCKAGGNREILELLEEAKAKKAVPYETVSLSRDGEFDEEQERLRYESDFKPKARILKRKTGESITHLRSRTGRYFVSTPGTLAVVRNGEVEWFTLGNEDIVAFLRKVLVGGIDFLNALIKEEDQNV